MGADPIRIELNEFNKLDLLRDEEERLTEELSGLEKSIRDVLLAAANCKFLSTISPYYSGKGPSQADLTQAQKHEAQRQIVAAALEAVKAQRQALEQTLGTTAAPAIPTARRAPRSGGGSRSNSFESFDDFRQSQPSKS